MQRRTIRSGTPSRAPADRRLQLSEETMRRATKLAALYQTTRDLSEPHQLPVVLQTIIERATDLLTAPCGIIYLYDDLNDDLELAAVEGMTVPVGTRLPLDKGLSSEVVRTQRPMRVAHYQSWQKRRPQYEDIPLAAVVEAPMLYGGQLIGVVGVAEFGKSTRHFNAEDEQLLSLVAMQAASAVHNARLFEQVRSSRTRLERLSHRLIEAQEAERRAIARELHDEIGQAMTGVQLNLQALSPYLTDPDARTLLHDNMAMIENVLHQVRDLSLALRPSILDDFGLVPAIQWLVKRQAQRTGMSIEFAADLKTRPTMQLETVCFRVVQEALTNIIRHARASQVSIELEQHGAELQLTIRDNGIGFDVSQALNRAARGASLGLLGMQERVSLVGARLEIESAPSEGTWVRVCFPLTSPFVERRARRRT